MKKLIVTVAMAALCSSASADETLFDFPNLWTVLVEQLSDISGTGDEPVGKDVADAPSTDAINGTGGRPEGTRAINGTGG